MSEDNFLQAYAARWQRSVTWAEQRFRFFDFLSELFVRTDVEPMLRSWAEDRERMQQAKMREAGIGDPAYCYWQGAANEVGGLVDNLRAELIEFNAARAAYHEEGTEE